MRRIHIWMCLGVVLLALLAISPWGASAAFPTNPAGSSLSEAGIDPALNLNVPLRNNWWQSVPNIDPATKLNRSLLTSWQSNANEQKGFMVYLKAQADTSNDITDWNAQGEYVLRQLETVANATQPQLMNAITAQQAAGRVTKAQKFTIINAIFVRGSMDAALELARRSDVALIEADHRYFPTKSNENAVASQAASLAAPASDPNTVELGVNYVRAPQAWAMGYRGEGIIVGSIDTGVDYTHPALSRQYRGNLGGGNFDHNYNWWDTREDAPRQNVPYDDDGHGTHTTGTVLGEDASQTNQIGVAPGAKWIAAKVFPNGGSSGNEEITPAQDFMLAPWDLNGQNRRPDLRPHVINNSWGDGECWNTDSWLITQAWIDAGIMPSFSNGNDGPGAGTVGSPGGYPFLLGVGAISASTNTIAGFSSRGPSCYGGVLKPDVVAPGVAVRSSIPGGGYGNNNGTSMAAPHVTGVLALIRQAAPQLDYDDVMSIMTRTAYFAPTWGARPNNNYGWGAVQADAAINMAVHGPHVSGNVTGNSAPLTNAQVTAIRTGDNETFSAEVNATGRYTMTLLAGTYDVTASAFGYQPQTVARTFMTDTNYTENFNLTALVSYLTSGQLLMAGACTPLSGTVSITPPGTMTITTGLDGTYNVNLPADTYQMVARAGAPYQPVTRTVTVAGPTVQNFTFGPAHDNGNTYTVDTPAFNWIAGTTPLVFDNGEDGFAAVPLPFPFTYYGNTYATINMSTNGYATFNDLSYARMWANTGIPNPGPVSDSTSYRYPNNALYPYWDDLSVDPRTFGDGYWGVSGVAPNRIFVLEWRGVGGADNPITFEIQLEESTNRITFLYQDVDAPYGYGYSSTTGIENEAGTDGIQIGFNEMGIVGNNMALRFKPEAPPSITECVGATATPTQPAVSPTMTATNTVVVPTVSPTAGTCSIQFSDVDETNTFYASIRCLACRGIVSGYSDGTFRPNNQVTRGQLAKMVSNSAGFSESITGQTFTDVPPTNTFYVWIERLARRGHMSGYNCGGPGEPCVNNMPYFRPFANATRGQTSKIVANAAGFSETPSGQTFEDVPPTHTFYEFIQRLASRNVMQGYACGRPDEPCVPPDNRPYFRPNNDVTRGQSSKIVANAFFPECVTP